ncbi:restriction endonuclease subunit S [Limosilactobacillus reuteri]|uniref:restriction endonuclease subunit S n=1 Tax=Limosilactobacillus reuteri TaxID=1598 RepID=UPI001E3A3A12|nr:restriction endonuclease subunit S [Limosilactobacillus reuteri]MCC4409868.1 restriction endonuclease subunit S [Limosilactobacillus reuteri]
MDKKPEKLVPEVRFKGFTDDWEQRKLGDFGNVQMNKRIFKSQTLDSGDVPFYKIGTFGKKADAYISSELYEEYRNKYPYPKDGDLLISASGSIGKIVEYKGQKAYYQDSNIVWLDHDNRILNLFLKAFFQIVKWNGTEGSTIKRLYNKNILNTEIILPKIKEQTAVGKLIEKVDYLITLQQRKLEQLRQLKIFTLQRMFIDKDCKQPILRFKNFNDNWLPHKFNDIANTFSGGTPAISNKDYYGGNIPFIRSAEINKNTTQLHLTPDGLKNSSAKFIKKGTLLYALYGATSGEVGIAQIDGAINQAVMAINLKKDNVYFIKTWLIKNKRKIISTYLQGGQGNLSAKIVKHLKLSLPKIEEEKLISITIMKIDSLIKLQQSKIDDLVNLKKYLLQKLFI